MNHNEKTLGIIGGMGTFAGLHFVNNFLNIWEKTYNIEKEWDYPRFILDNNCKLPSRVRAILYQEESPAPGLIKSVYNLKNCGADVIVIPCITAHYFLPEIQAATDIEIIDILDIFFKYLRQNKIESINILASEGTIAANLFKRYDDHIHIKYSQQLHLLRTVIESVKHKAISPKTIRIFQSLLDNNACNVMGCTEFSKIYSENKKIFRNYRILDPEDYTAKYLVEYLH